MSRERLSRQSLRWLSYRGVCAAIHQPLLLRALSRLLREMPGLAGAAGTVATRDDVAAVFDRQALFSSAAHRPNLVVGDFLIGMESGPAHALQRRTLAARLPKAEVFGVLAAQESQVRVQALLNGPVRRIDVVTDYMVPIAWRCLRSCFGDSLPALTSNDPLFAHLQHIGAHLIVGSVATARVQSRASKAAMALDAWIRARLPQIRAAWAAPGSALIDDEELVRDATGLLWVGHPASVQALALVVIDLLGRPEWELLAARARALYAAGQDPWVDPALCVDAQAHVVESLRFRPPFPVLRREVLRDGHMGSRPPRRVTGGKTVTLLGIGAMFDPAAHADPASADRYCPARRWVAPDDGLFMFGHGPRPCIARDHVVQMLASSLIGLLLLPGLKFGDPWYARFRLDGPAITRLRLRFVD